MVSLRFPVRLSSAAFYADRKLFANGFLLAKAPMALLSHRKLFAKSFPLDVAPLVLLTHRKLFDRKLSIHYIFTDCE